MCKAESIALLLIPLVGFCQSAVILDPPELIPLPLPPPVCMYEGVPHQEDTTFNPNACTFCTCPKGGGDPLCAMMACLAPFCVNPVTNPGECCASCPDGPNCEHSDGKVYPVGDFKPSPCEFCQCSKYGQITCAIADCMMQACVDAVSDPDQCCPVCPNGPNCWAEGQKIPANEDVEIDGKICRCPDFSLDQQAECHVIPTPVCLHDGKPHPPGEFHPSPCEKCICPDEGGQAHCAAMGCQTPPCVDAVKLENQCCSTCPNGPNCYGRNNKIVAAGKFFKQGRKVCKCPDLLPGDDPTTRKAVCKRNRRKLKKRLNAG